ncbi:DNA-methyltransferase [Cetobacterium sp.]|uniref:DNA-methyltransferase n=1 Tax=Cetobacterium sp. TaxID=2071632 RepID=UPI003F306F44
MIRLFNEDCFAVMDRLIKEGVKVDCVIADIPYGTTNCKWDSVLDLERMWSLLYKLRKDKRTPIILFAQTPFDKVLGVSNLKDLRYEWIWQKTTPTGFLNSKKMPLKSHENILVFYEKLPKYIPQKTKGHKPVNSYTKKANSDKGIYGETAEVSGGGSTERYPTDIIKFKSDKQKLSLHPTQKPLGLLEYLVKTYTEENDTVLDFTMGSGTAGVACKRLNRNFIGIEINPEKDKFGNLIEPDKYFKIAKRRIENETNIKNN